MTFAAVGDGVLSATAALVFEDNVKVFGGVDVDRVDLLDARPGVLDIWSVFAGPDVMAAVEAVDVLTIVEEVAELPVLGEALGELGTATALGVTRLCLIVVDNEAEVRLVFVMVNCARVGKVKGTTDDGAVAEPGDEALSEAAVTGLDAAAVIVVSAGVSVFVIGMNENSLRVSTWRRLFARCRSRWKTRGPCDWFDVLEGANMMSCIPESRICVLLVFTIKLVPVDRIVYGCRRTGTSAERTGVSEHTREHT